MSYQPYPNNKLSTSNSSTVTLTAGQIFYGEWEQITPYDSVVVTAKTDQNGSLSAQFSPDGINVDSSLLRYYRTNQIEPPHRFTLTRPFYRIVFQNTSSSSQTYFRLQSIYGDKSPLNIPLDANMSQDYDAVAVRPSDYKYEVSLGKRQGQTAWSKFGYNTDIDIGTEIIGAMGGTFTPLLVASTLTIVSSSTSDNGVVPGVGAQTIVITGVDANRVYQSETVILNGTTNVVTSTTWLGINRVGVSLAGTSLSNVGNITISATTGGSIQGYVPVGEGYTQQSIFFTQASHTFLADYLTLNAEKTGSGATPKVRFKGWLYNANTNCKYLVFNKLMDTASENTVSVSPSQPFTIPEKSVLWFEATTDAADTFCSCRFSGIEFRSVDA